MTVVTGNNACVSTVHFKNKLFHLRSDKNHIAQYNGKRRQLTACVQRVTYISVKRLVELKSLLV